MYRAGFVGSGNRECYMLEDGKPPESTEDGAIRCYPFNYTVRVNTTTGLVERVKYWRHRSAKQVKISLEQAKDNAYQYARKNCPFFTKYIMKLAKAELVDKHDNKWYKFQWRAFKDEDIKKDFSVYIEVNSETGKIICYIIGYPKEKVFG